MPTSLPLAHLEVKLIFEGEDFNVEKFKIGFAQASDYKGQPQHEIQGGQIIVSLTHIATDGMYTWAKTPHLLKDGTILFQTDLGMTVLEVNFFNAYCVNLTRDLSAEKGTVTNLVISPEKVKMNGFEHNNHW